MNPTAILARVAQLRKIKEQRKKAKLAKKSNEPKPLVLSDVFVPNPGPQAQFVESTCREILYGGAAGGGKSAALTALPLKWAHLPGFLSLTLRRESTQLKDLIAKANTLYSKAFPGKHVVNKRGRETFETPSGAQFLWGHCKEKRDFTQFDGWEINLLCFDELTHFTHEQYTAICARVRSSNPDLPTLIRATTNPGGEGHEWVFKHWGAWLDPEFEAEGLPKKSERSPGEPPAKPGEVWWIRTNADGSETYYRTEQATKHGEPPTLSRTFIPAKLEDNPKLADNDPAYVAQLNMLDTVRREQLKNGNWLIKPAAGLFFKRVWVRMCKRSDVPRDAKFCRGWDRAATEKTDENDPDFTVGLLMARKDGQIWIVDRKKERWGPGKVEKLIVDTAAQDATQWSKGTLVSIPQDPGQAGKDQKYRMIDKLSGYLLRMRAESGDKIVRFSPFSSFCENGKDLGVVNVVEADWNNDYFATLEGFDGSGKQKDDDVDATSTAFEGLNSKLLNSEYDGGVGIGEREMRTV